MTNPRFILLFSWALTIATAAGILRMAEGDTFYKFLFFGITAAIVMVFETDHIVEEAWQRASALSIPAAFFIVGFVLPPGYLVLHCILVIVIGAGLQFVLGFMLLDLFADCPNRVVEVTCGRCIQRYAMFSTYVSCALFIIFHKHIYGN